MRQLALRLAALLFTGVGVLAGSATSAMADPIECPQPVTGAASEQFTTSFSCDLSGDGTTVQGTASDGTKFTFQPVCEKDYGSVNPQVFGGCTGQVECGENGIIYQVTIIRPDGSQESVNDCFDTPRRRPGRHEVAQVLKEVPLPASVIEVQPPDGKTLVNLETIMSTVAEPFEASRTLRGFVVVFTITPHKFLWHHGDETAQETWDAGRPWEPGLDPKDLINHVYKSTASGLELSVDTTWRATWTLDGVDQGPVDGFVVRPGEPVDLDVLEAKPQLVVR